MHASVSDCQCWSNCPLPLQGTSSNQGERSEPEGFLQSITTPKSLQFLMCLCMHQSVTASADLIVLCRYKGRHPIKARDRNPRASCRASPLQNLCNFWCVYACISEWLPVLFTMLDSLLVLQSLANDRSSAVPQISKASCVWHEWMRPATHHSGRIRNPASLSWSEHPYSSHSSQMGSILLDKYMQLSSSALGAPKCAHQLRLLPSPAETQNFDLSGHTGWYECTSSAFPQ
jgi:hypothetical protein